MECTPKKDPNNAPSRDDMLLSPRQGLDHLLNTGPDPDAQILSNLQSGTTMKLIEPNIVDGVITSTLSIYEVHLWFDHPTVTFHVDFKHKLDINDNVVVPHISKPSIVFPLSMLAEMSLELSDDVFINYGSQVPLAPELCMKLDYQTASMDEYDDMDICQSVRFIGSNIRCITVWTQGLYHIARIHGMTMDSCSDDQLNGLNNINDCQLDKPQQPGQRKSHRFSMIPTTKSGGGSRLTSMPTQQATLSYEQQQQLQKIDHFYTDVRSLHSRSVQAQTELASIKKEYHTLIEQLQIQFKNKCHELSNKISQQNDLYTQRLHDLEHAHKHALNDALDAYHDKIKQLDAQYTTTINTLSQRLNNLQATNKHLLNTIIESTGNIRTFVRIRPLLPFEAQESCIGVTDQSCNINAQTSQIGMPVKDDVASLVSREMGSYTVSVTDEQSKVTEHSFEQVFTESSTQENVAVEVMPFVQSVVDGYNLCIFAYGQTGSGKTFTMEGTDQQPGVNYAALNGLFNLLQERQKQLECSGRTMSFTVELSVLEIYNETVKDLVTNQPVELSFLNNTCTCKGLSSTPVTDCASIKQILLTSVKKHRAVAKTDMNAQSSRSHCVIFVNVKSIIDTSLCITSRLVLIDLAGSERVSKSGVQGDGFKEAANINKSLANLGNVLNALQNNAKHIPYRDSKLTTLLADSLGGDSKVLMFCNISPCSTNASETNSSLNFAQRASRTQLGKAGRNTSQASNTSNTSSSSCNSNNSSRSTISSQASNNTNELLTVKNKQLDQQIQQLQQQIQTLQSSSQHKYDALKKEYDIITNKSLEQDNLIKQLQRQNGNLTQNIASSSQLNRAAVPSRMTAVPRNTVGPLAPGRASMRPTTTSAPVPRDTINLSQQLDSLEHDVRQLSGPQGSRKRKSTELQNDTSSSSLSSSSGSLPTRGTKQARTTTLSAPASTTTTPAQPRPTMSSTRNTISSSNNNSTSSLPAPLSRTRAGAVNTSASAASGATQQRTTTRSTARVGAAAIASSAPAPHKPTTTATTTGRSTISTRPTTSSRP